MTRRTAISRKELAHRGWTPVHPETWRSKTDARYEHVDGWTLSHCGHPTALHPWLLKDPRGRVVLTGSLYGTPPRPDFGTAFDTLEDATRYVSSLDRHERENGPRWFETAPETHPA